MPGIFKDGIMYCVECGVADSKYKCPTCSQPYCSVSCCKKHKQTPCTAPVPAPIQDQEKHEPLPSYEFPTEDTVSPEKLKLLEHSEEVKKCLENPYVREILEIIDRAPHPDQLMEDYMQEPIFTEFVDACLKVVQTKETDN